MGVLESFVSKPAEWYRRGIEHLTQRWTKAKYDGIFRTNLHCVGLEMVAVAFRQPDIRYTNQSLCQ